MTLRNNGVHANVTSNNDTFVLPRAHIVLLDCTKKHVCELCTNAQHCTCHKHHKEAQPIYSKLDSALRSRISPAGANNQSTMEELAEACDSMQLLLMSNGFHRGVASPPN